MKPEQRSRAADRRQGMEEDRITWPGNFGAGNGRLLLYSVLALTVLLISWAGFAELDEVTRGSGRIIPSRQVQLVQNLEGGILAELLAAEGEVVDAGQVLLRIQNTKAASELEGGHSRLLALRATIARLKAEVGNAPLTFPVDVLRDGKRMAGEERALFEARRTALRSEQAVLESAMEQRRQEVAELEHKRRQLQRSVGLAKEELALTEPLAARRVVPKIDLLRLHREVNDLSGALESTELALPRVQLALDEARMRMAERLAAFQLQAQRELTAVQTEAMSLAALLDADSDRVARTDVRSPVRGTVKRLFVTTKGGVIKPGQDLAEIVPLEDTLLVEARVPPADIAFLHPGQKAMVKITAYDFAQYGGLLAAIEDISADSIADSEGQSYFRVRVRTQDGSLISDGEALPIMPGMTAEVDILTGKKTVLDYLLKPVLRMRHKALRER